MNQQMNTYEGMFLVPPGISDFEQASQPVKSVLERCEAEILTIKPWDERRLAYEIKGNRRGLYILTHFKADPTRVPELEHDCQLNERILRVLVLRRERLTDEVMNAQTPATIAARREEAAAPAEPGTEGQATPPPVPDTAAPEKVAEAPVPDTAAPAEIAEAPVPEPEPIAAVETGVEAAPGPAETPPAAPDDGPAGVETSEEPQER